MYCKRVEIQDMQYQRGLNSEYFGPSEILAISKDYIAVTSTKDSGILIFDRHYRTLIKKLNFKRNTVITQLTFNPGDQDEILTATHTRRFFNPGSLNNQHVALPYESTSFRIQYWKLTK